MLVGLLLTAGSGVNSQRGREVWRSLVRAIFWKVACLRVNFWGSWWEWVAYGFFLLLLDALAVGALLGDVVVDVCLGSSCRTVLVSMCVLASFVVVCEVVVVNRTLIGALMSWLTKVRS